MELYNKLKKIEDLMDKAALKRKLLIEESHCQRIKCIKTLRIFITLSLDPFTLRINGRVINDYKNSVTYNTSTLLKRLYVEINNSNVEGIEGVSNKSSRLEGVNNIGSKLEGFDISTNTQQGVNTLHSNIRDVEGVSNKSSNQLGVNISTNTQQGVNILHSKQQGVNIINGNITVNEVNDNISNNNDNTTSTNPNILKHSFLNSYEWIRSNEVIDGFELKSTVNNMSGINNSDINNSTVNMSGINNSNVNSTVNNNSDINSNVNNMSGIINSNVNNTDTYITNNTNSNTYITNTNTDTHITNTSSNTNTNPNINTNTNTNPNINTNTTTNPTNTNTNTNNTSISVSFLFDNNINKYKITPCLSNIIKRDTDTKSNIIIETWKYIRMNRLISNKGKNIVICDDNLKRCFKCDTFDINELSTFIDKCIIGVDSLNIEIPYYNNYKRVFDVRMECDDLVDFPVIYSNKTILALERKIGDLSDMICKTKERSELLGRFAMNPKQFIDEWVVLQARDSSVVEECYDSKSEFFYQPLVQETIYALMQNYK